MNTDGTAALERLLVEAEAAHGVYEKTELNGVYDEEWPRWYAQYAVDHGIADLVGRAMSVDELAQLLTRSWDEQQRADTQSTESWSAFTARRLAAER